MNPFTGILRECDLLRNTFLNLVGLGFPLVVAIFTIPLLIAALGIERFGILALIWALVSYFGLFDLGLGRALTRELAALRALGDADTAKRLVATALGVMGVLGVTVGLILGLGAEWSVRQLGGVTDAGEVVHAVYAMAFAMPFIMMAAGLRGVLEAERSFAIINAIRLPMGIFTFLAPLAVVNYWDNDLGLVAATLTGGRVLAYFAHVWFCRHIPTVIPVIMPIDLHLMKRLLQTGGWMTISNVISPLMGYLDRYVIGVTISVAAVAYYAIPYEIITKLWIIPGALTAVLFPRFAEMAARDRLQGRTLFRQSTLLLFVSTYPIALGVALFSRELLELWLDADFAARSYPLLQVFACGILLTCLAHVPFTFLQGVGRSDITAKIHVLEFPVYVLLLWLAAQNFGLSGAVVVWFARVFGDTLLLFHISLRNMDTALHHIFDWKLGLVLFAALASFGAIYIGNTATRLILWMVSVMLSSLLCWQLLLSASDRAALVKRFLHADA